MFEKIRRPGRSFKDGRIKKWFSYFIFGLICIVFVFLAPMGSQFIGEGVVGYVGKEPIRFREFRVAEENIRQNYKSRLEQADTENYSRIQKNIRQTALKYLVDSSLLSQGAKQAGFLLSDDELRSEIRSFAVFQHEGRFIYSRYLEFLKSQKMNHSRFEERMRKYKTADNWRLTFDKAIFTNKLEKEKKSQRHVYKMNFRYAQFPAGDVEEERLEPLLRSKNLKKINKFIKENKAEWEKTGVFSLLSAFGLPITRNQSVMEALLQQIPSRGLIPRLIRHGDQVYIVELLSFKKGKPSLNERRMESFLERNYDKSSRLLDSWLELQKQKTPVKISNPL